MRSRVLVALASQQRRAEFLPKVLASLAPQADELAVFLNGYTEAPACVLELAEQGRLRYELSAENLGAEKKFHWARSWEGIYCSADDDLVYPPEYVETMVAAVQRWHGMAIVTAHGRVYRSRACTVYHVMPGSVGIVHNRIDNGRWVNHGGTGVMAWNTRIVPVPDTWPERNIADMQLAIWAQEARVPIWLIPHQAHWFESLATLDPEGLFKTSQRDGHRRRNELLRRHSARGGWQLHQVEL